MAAVVATGKQAGGGGKYNHSQFRLLDEERMEVSELRDGVQMKIVKLLKLHVRR